MDSEFKDRGRRWRQIAIPIRSRFNVAEYGQLALKQQSEKQSELQYDFGSNEEYVWWKWPVHGQDEPWWGVTVLKPLNIPVEIKQLQIARSYPTKQDKDHYAADLHFRFHGMGNDVGDFDVVEEAKVTGIRDYSIQGSDMRIPLEAAELSNATRREGSTTVAYLTLNTHKITEPLSKKLKKKLEIPETVYPGQKVECYLSMVATEQKVRVFNMNNRDVSLSLKELEDLGITKFELEDGVKEIRLRLTVHDFSLEIDLSREPKASWWREIFESKDQRKINPITKTRISFASRECCE